MDASIFNWGFNLGPGMIILILWSLLWKGIALWKSGRNNQLVWFLLVLMLNTAGTLPIIYIFFFQKKQRKTTLGKREAKYKKIVGKRSKKREKNFKKQLKKK